MTTTTTPARTVRKAGAQEPVIPVYDANRVLIGTVPPGALIPVANAGAAPAKPAQDDAVAKAAALKKAAFHAADPRERVAALRALNDATFQAISDVHARRQ